MDADTFAKWLEEHGACQEAKTWARGKTLREAWDGCSNLVWMFWLVRRSHSPDFYKNWGNDINKVARANGTSPSDGVRREMPYTQLLIAMQT